MRENGREIMLNFHIKLKYRYLRNRLKQDRAVSEIVGELLMLMIVISSIGVLYYKISLIQPPITPPRATIIGRVERNTLVLEHKRGESLSPDTRITINMGIINATFLAENYLDNKSKKDGEWNIGECLIYPFPFTLNTIQSYFPTYVNTADIESNSLVFYATFDVYPETDLGVTMTVDNLSPPIGSQVNFTVCVTNYQGGTPAVNIELLIMLSKNFSYFSNLSSCGEYNSQTGVWMIPSLERGESACLTITAIVTLSSVPTQLAMVLDGSGSISSGDWSLMKEGLARSIENSSIFPHDGTVELTVIQFGQTTAQVEVQPILVNKNNYLSIGNQIRNIRQLRGYTPISCGIRLAADLLRSSGYFNAAKRQIINLVTDGVANCYWRTGYTGTYQGYDGWCKGDDQHHSGNYSAKSTYNRRGDFTCNDIDTTGATNITVDFWYRLDDTERDDLYLYYYDGSTYHYIKSLGGSTEDTWLHYTDIITDPQYFNQNFKIRFKTYLDYFENIWIDDILIQTKTNELLNDSFESDYWAEHWWNPGLKSTEEASSYLINELQMTDDQDEFDALGVGVGGQYGGPDVDWLKNKIVWSQPGNLAPPYIPGWAKTITTWQEFENTIMQIFRGYFGISNINTVKIIETTPSTDPNPDNNEVSIILTPG